MRMGSWKRRDFLLRGGQSALALLVAGRAGQLAIAQETKPTTVLEARDRVGGRVYTLEDLPGKPEAGEVSARNTNAS